MAQRQGAPCTLLALWGALFLPPLLRGHTFPARDAGATHIPWRAEVAHQLARGQAPWWNPLANGGRLLWANPNSQAAYPLTWALAPLGPERSLALAVAAHHLLFLLGCYALTRRAGASPGGAAVGAAAAGFSGRPLSATLLPNLQASLAWGPWALAAALPSPPPAPPRRAALGGLCLGLSFLGGEPVTAGLVALAWGWLVACTHGRRAPLALAWGAGVALAVAAPVLVPLLAAWGDTARAVLGTTPAAFAADALAPRRWPELFLPHLLGDFHASGAPHFWAAPSFPWLRYFPALFVGLLPPLLGLRAGWRRRTAPWWGLTGAGAAAAVLGGVAPAPLAVPYVRYAVKFLVLLLLALAPLTALGWDRLAARGGRSARRHAAAAALPAFLALTAAALPERLVRPLLARAYPAAAEALAQVPAVALTRALLQDGAALALPLGVLAAAPGAPLALAAAAGAGGLAATWGLVVGEPGARWAAPPPAAAGLARGSRLAALAPAAAAPSPGHGGPLAHYHAMRAALVPNYPNRWGLGTVLERGPDGLEAARHELLAAAAATLSVAERVRVAAALGAAVAVTSEALPHLAGEEVGGVWRWRLPAAPEAYLARRLHFARGTLAAAVTLASPAFRPGEDAVVEGDGGVQELSGGRLTALPGPPHRRRFWVEAPAAALLVLQQSHMGCWRAWVDGKAAPLAPVNGAMMGVWVPAGAHVVAVELDPTPYRVGLLGPALALLACGLTRRGGAWPGPGAASGAPGRSSPATSPAP